MSTFLNVKRLKLYSLGFRKPCRLCKIKNCGNLALKFIQMGLSPKKKSKKMALADSRVDAKRCLRQMRYLDAFPV